jgi:hypothetical protein
MNQFVKFTAGMLARMLGIVAEQFARWTFRRVSEGADAGLDLLSDFWEFAEWLLQTIAGQLSGRPIRHYDDYEEEWQRGGAYGR